jgi:RimJ/RimL family protein N-acetyltransferase
LNDAGILVGFFYVHLNEGTAAIGFPGREYALIRSLSIDERFQRRGYASASMKLIYPFANDFIDDKISKVILAVNVENYPAIKAYENAGFSEKLGVRQGRIGELYLLQKSRRTVSEEER